MRDYVFFTDSDSDMPYQIFDKMDAQMIMMPYSLDGKDLVPDLGRSNDNGKPFFDRMRAGAVPSTSLLPTPVYIDCFEKYLAAGRDILVIAFSSKMSNTIQNMNMAKDELLEKYPERRIEIVDTLSISGPQTLLTVTAYEMYEKGASMDEVKDWVMANRLRARAYFTVNDLVYLKRGGRISNAAAFFGSMLDLKPILVEGRLGKVSPAEKVQGRKKAIRTIAARVKETIVEPEKQRVIILHADCEGDAARLCEHLSEMVPEIQTDVYPIGPVIGAHCGPGTLAACFMGIEREVD
ncbi:MAG: DegV family protein [Eubacteriales bacterium]|nr:DegV family protein [Eubacteriales bacterium]